jgi:hypothetical protein
LKALLLVAYGLAAFACGVYSLSKQAPVEYALLALLAAVVCGVAAWWV